MPAPPPPAQLKVAIVHDWLDTWRGGENALAEVIGVYPQADLFALVDFLPDAQRGHILGKHARTSFLQRIPGAARHFRALLPLFPRAIESLDVSRYDLVISISHAVAKGVRTHRRQLHVCYCLTPMRYAWDLRETYLASAGVRRGPRRLMANAMLDRLRRWDLATSSRVDQFIAISDYIRARIRRCYAVEATVVHPPVDVDYFVPGATPPSRLAYCTASRWVAYKRLDLIVEAFRALPEHRLIVAGDGPELRRARKRAGSNVAFLGEVSRERLRDVMRDARAFIFAAEEDFGIAPLEAQACGTPVIAYGRGGAAETILGLDAAQPTGMFFAAQSAESIRAAILSFEQRGVATTAAACRANAQRFAPELFRQRLAGQIDIALAAFRARQAAPSPC
jgi:glycosyltransferase involved in cell wall biosynthesis